MTEEKTITGIYVAHWEVGRLVVETGRRFFGLLPRIEKWQAIFPSGFNFLKSENPRGPAIVRYKCLKNRCSDNPKDKGDYL